MGQTDRKFSVRIKEHVKIFGYIKIVSYLLSQNSEDRHVNTRN